MSKYLKRLGEAADDKKAKANSIAEAHAKASIEQNISGFKAKAATLEGAYESALGENPFNFHKVFGLTKEKAENDAALELAESLLETEFSAE